MASLSSMPTEILTLIIQAIGHPHLYHCLTLNKRWYEIAQVAIVTEINLSSEGVLRFRKMSAPVQALFKRHLRSIWIELPGHERFNPIDGIPSAPNHTDGVNDADTRPVASSAELHCCTFEDDVQASLVYLADFLRSCGELQEYRLRGGQQCLRFVHEEGRDVYLFQYLSGDVLSTLFPIIPSTNLTSLEVDLIWDHEPLWLEGPHFCPPIARLVGQVKHLRLKLPKICAVVLDVPKNRDGGGRRLETVVINLCLYGLPWTGEFFPHSERCGGNLGFERRLDDLEKWFLPKAMQVAKGFSNLRMMRILYDRGGDAGMVALDCVTGKEIREKEACWGGWLHEREDAYYWRRYNGSIAQD